MKQILVLSLISIYTSLALANPPAGYPAHWWKPVPEKDLASWEIPPQAAGPGEVILSKRNELGLMSNFGATPIHLKGKGYASIEGLWQSMKYPEDKNDPRNQPGIVWPFSREQVRAMVGREAYEAGKATRPIYKKLGINWVSFEGEQIEYKGKGALRHYEIILEASRAKIEQNKNVRDVLFATCGLNLKPDHNVGPSDPPAYRYYDLYMKIRAERVDSPCAAH